jgi:transcription termination factor NusB
VARALQQALVDRHNSQFQAAEFWDDRDRAIPTAIRDAIPIMRGMSFEDGSKYLQGVLDRAPAAFE